LNYIAKIGSTKVDSLVITKGIEWIHLILSKDLNEKPDEIKSFGENILFISRFLIKNEELRDLKIWTILPLWIMKYGIKEVERLTGSFSEEKIVWELYTFLYCNKELWTNYHLALDRGYHSGEGWFHYVSAAFWLKTHNFQKWDCKIMEYPGNNVALSNSGDLLQALKSMKLFDFQKQISSEIVQQNTKILKKIIYNLLQTRAISIDAPTEIHSLVNTDLNTQIIIHNSADWVFYDAEFCFIWTPENRMTFRIMNQSNSKTFDIERKLDFKILPLNSGRTHLQLELHFRDPFNKEQRDHFTLWEITAEFEKI
jgi:hypothetical protein